MFCNAYYILYFSILLHSLTLNICSFVRQEKHMSSTWLATPHREKIGIAEQQLLEESIL
jgi:hypothetical protein